MYCKTDITSGNRKFTYAKKGDSVNVLDSKKHPVLLCERNGERFMCNADQLQVEPLFLDEIKSPVDAAKSELRKELRKLLARDSYQFKIIFNRVYYDKVSKFPRNIDRKTWLEIATQLWEVSAVGSTPLIDAIKANQ